MMSSPLTAGNLEHGKKAESAMRMTQPSSTDSAAQFANLGGPDGNGPDVQTTPGGYASMSDFGTKKHKGPSSFLNRNGSKVLSGSGLGKRGPSLNKTGGAGGKALPAIDHSKVMEKLRSITGKSEDFAAASVGSDSNVQFSKPKIGVKARIVSSSTQGLTRAHDSKKELRTGEKEGSKSSMAPK